MSELDVAWILGPPIGAAIAIVVCSILQAADVQEQEDLKIENARQKKQIGDLLYSSLDVQERMDWAEGKLDKISAILLEEDTEEQ